jgi:hypothetical protein
MKNLRAIAITGIIRQISRQPLRMRNEQFGFPPSGAEVQALDPRALRRAAI